MAGEVVEVAIDGTVTRRDYTPAEQAAADAAELDALNVWKKMKKNQLNAERAELFEDLTVEMDGVVYDAHTEARTNITSTVGAITSGIAVPNPLGWRSKANTTVFLSHPKIIELGGLMMVAVNTLYQTSWALKEAVDNASTEAEVDSITWPE